MVIGERCLTINSFTTLEIFTELATGTNDPGMGSFDAEGYSQSASYRDDFLFSLDNLEELLKALETPFPEAIAVARTFGPNVQVATEKRYLISALTLPALGSLVWSRYPEAEARLRVVLAVLAVERARLQNSGRLSENSDDPAIQPALARLVDPFDGKSIRYHKRAANAYVVYSVGPDGKDDGGVPKDALPKGQTTYDLAFFVGPPLALTARPAAAPAQSGTQRTGPPANRPRTK
jgi:hypothetical protein